MLSTVVVKIYLVFSRYFNLDAAIAREVFQLQHHQLNRINMVVEIPISPARKDFFAQWL
jgi:hypothetical protein